VNWRAGTGFSEGNVEGSKVRDFATEANIIINTEPHGAPPPEWYLYPEKLSRECVAATDCDESEEARMGGKIN
jgi:hypothetical protein